MIITNLLGCTCSTLSDQAKNYWKTIGWNWLKVVSSTTEAVVQYVLFGVTRGRYNGPSDLITRILFICTVCSFETLNISFNNFWHPFESVTLWPLNVTLWRGLVCQISEQQKQLLRKQRGNQWWLTHYHLLLKLAHCFNLPPKRCVKHSHETRQLDDRESTNQLILDIKPNDLLASDMLSLLTLYSR